MTNRRLRTPELNRDKPRRLGLAALALAWGLCPQSVAAEESANEYQLKAAFLYNLARMTEWPSGAGAESTDAPFGVCFIGDNPFGDALDSIRQKEVRSQALTFREQVTPEEVAGCRIVFIGASEKPRLNQILTALQSQPILTIGDTESFAEYGCIINLITEGARVRVDVNLKAAQRAGVVISSRILTLARIVGEDGSLAPASSLDIAQSITRNTMHMPNHHLLLGWRPRSG